MSETSRTLRAIAHNYIKAAEHMEAAEWLAASLDSSPHAAVEQTDATARERIAALDAELAARLERASARLRRDLADIEPMETIGDVVVEPAGATISDAYTRCISTLGWDPDTLSGVEVVAHVGCLSSIDELDCAEVLEKRRVEMTPRRSSRSTVLTAIAKRRAELEAAGVQS
jgi:hypothetical protein